MNDDRTINSFPDVGPQICIDNAIVPPEAFVLFVNSLNLGQYEDHLGALLTDENFNAEVGAAGLAYGYRVMICNMQDTLRGEEDEAVMSRCSEAIRIAKENLRRVRSMLMSQLDNPDDEGEREPGEEG